MLEHTTRAIPRRFRTSRGRSTILGAFFEVPHWIKVKNPAAPAVTREAEEGWNKARLVGAFLIWIKKR